MTKQERHTTNIPRPFVELNMDEEITSLTYTRSTKIVSRSTPNLSQMKKRFLYYGNPEWWGHFGIDFFSMENGEKYHFSCVHFSLFFEDEVATIFCQIWKIHTKVWAYIFRNIGPMKKRTFFRSAPVCPVHPSMIFIPWKRSRFLQTSTPVW